MQTYNTPQEWLTNLEAQSEPQASGLTGLVMRYGLASNPKTAQYILAGAGALFILLGWLLWRSLNPAQTRWSAETRLEIQADLERMRHPLP